MRIKLIETGYHKFTGPMGQVNFENGISEEITRREADALGASMRIEVLDDETYIGNVYERAQEVSAPVQTPVVAEPEPETVVESTAPAYTEDQLAAIADKEGIAGLRVIADPLGVKGVSIRALIDGILKKA